MSRDMKLLPLPGPYSDVQHGYYWEDMEAYARANMAELLAENERLRADAERYRFLASQHSLAWEEELDAAIERDRAQGVSA